MKLLCISLIFILIATPRIGFSDPSETCQENSSRDGLLLVLIDPIQKIGRVAISGAGKVAAVPYYVVRGVGNTLEKITKRSALSEDALFGVGEPTKSKTKNQPAIKFSVYFVKGFNKEECKKSFGTTVISKDIEKLEEKRPGQFKVTFKSKGRTLPPRIYYLSDYAQKKLPNMNDKSWDDSAIFVFDFDALGKEIGTNSINWKFVRTVPGEKKYDQSNTWNRTSETPTTLDYQWAIYLLPDKEAIWKLSVSGTKNDGTSFNYEWDFYTF